MKPRHSWVGAPPSGRLFHSTVPTPLGRITWAGRHHEHRWRRPMAMRYWDTYALVYVISGQGRFQDQDGLDQPVGTGDLLLMFPRHGYRYWGPPAQPWSEFFLQFRGPLFGLWVREGLISPRRPVHHLEPVGRWWNRLEAIITPLPLPEPSQSLKRLCLLQEFLVDAALAPRAAPVPRDQEWLARAQAALAQHLGAPLDWAALAAGLGLSYQRFRKKYVALTGVAPGRYRAGKVIEHVETLLRNPQLPLAEIATRCGFCDQFHLARRFRQFTGVTPAQYRRKLS